MGLHAMLDATGLKEHGAPPGVRSSLVPVRALSAPTPPCSSVEDLTQRYGHLSGAALLRPMIETEFAGKLAVVSSFGTEAAIMLALVAAIDRSTPVLVLDTGKLFSDTLRYRDRLVELLGLRDVRTLSPDRACVARDDPDGMRWLSDPDGCCALRKSEPLARALAPFAAWVSGRKRYHGTERSSLSPFEADSQHRIKINPLIGWSRTDIEAEFAARNLPRHPLQAEGYLSVGCLTCTDRVKPGEDLRAGRWRHLGKTECGIHLSPLPRIAV
jgi:phosphoadenosine phosphosulfate reductase